jgi:hypothetical protein
VQRRGPHIVLYRIFESGVRIEFVLWITKKLLLYWLWLIKVPIHNAPVRWSLVVGQNES